MERRGKGDRAMTWEEIELKKEGESDDEEAER